MSDRTTINVSKKAHRTASKAKQDDESWSDYLLRSVDESPHEPAQSDVDTSELMRKLEQIESAQANTVSKALETAESSAELGYDDVVAACKKAISEEWEGGLR